MFYRSLQILRGLAAVAVVLYHCGCYAELAGGNPHTVFRAFGNPWSYGAWFFFTLSGFLMAQLIDTGCAWFLPRRILRIYPTYLVAVMAVLFAKAIVFQSLQTPYLLRAVTLLPMGATVKGVGIGYPLGVEWTLIFEVFFYLVCSLFAWRPMRRAFLPFLILWAGVIVYCSLAIGRRRWINDHETWNLPTIASIWFSQMNLLFIAGGWAYYALKWWRSPGKIGSAGVAVAAVAAFAMFGWGRLPGAVHLLSLGAGFAMLVMLVCSWERSREKGLRIAVLERWGDYSYGLYLVHVQVLVVMILMVRASSGGAVIGDLGMVAAFAAAMIGGGVFGAIDLRIHDYWRRWFATLTNRIGTGRPTREVTLQSTARER